MNVYALVGPSGTGKSHRAILVSHENKCEIIVDDGLVIMGDQILVGHTAKKQPTVLSAIRAALFIDPEQARLARDAIVTNNPSGVLILGTSLGMVKKIGANLGLPPLSRIIDISDVATPEDIKKARILRTRFSRHVIPAPTMEVIKSFPGTLIDPLRVLIRREKDHLAGKKDWHEQSVVRPTYTFYGKLTISEQAIASIAIITARSVSGVKNPGKVHVSMEESGLTVEISPVIYFGSYLPGVSKRLQTVIKDKIEYMTGLSVKNVDVVIKEIDLKKTRHTAQ